MNDITALQPLVVGSILVWAGLGKVLGRLSAARARRSALPRLVGDRHAGPAYRAAGGLELVVGAGLLLPPYWSPDASATTVLAIAFLCYLTYARLAAPDSSCGCLGSASVPVSARSIVRGVLLLAASLAVFLADGSWTTVVTDRPVTAAVVVIVQVAGFVSLSPELDRWWLIPLRRLRVRLTHPLAGGPATTPLASTVQQLLRSPAYRAVGAMVRSDIRDHWDDGEWRFVTYAVSYGDETATGVFAVPLRDDPDAIRMAIVDDRTGATLYRPEPAAAVTT